ncbi:MAG: hypothetical protein JWP25_4096 [Bradyrhizobium sp.]|jgi:hypothetical protein|nr:hypothetical protein [Bradyrhizobium sp.]MEA2868337.1 hypothetical protein [Bradyrhizobium sp.]
MDRHLHAARRLVAGDAANNGSPIPIRSMKGASQAGEPRSHGWNFPRERRRETPLTRHRLRPSHRRDRILPTAFGFSCLSFQSGQQARGIPTPSAHSFDLGKEIIDQRRDGEAGAIAAKIFKGAKPVEQPIKFEFVINRRLQPPILYQSHESAHKSDHFMIPPLSSQRLILSDVF